MKENNKLNIVIEGFEVRLVETTTAWIIRKLLDAKLKFTGKVYLPTEVEKVTVLKSPHKHKDSQECLGRKTHRRLLQVKGASFADLNKVGLTGSYPQISRGVRIRIKV